MLELHEWQTAHLNAHPVSPLYAYACIRKRMPAYASAYQTNDTCRSAHLHPSVVYACIRLRMPAYASAYTRRDTCRSVHAPISSAVYIASLRVSSYSKINENFFLVVNSS